MATIKAGFKVKWNHVLFKQSGCAIWFDGLF